MSADTELLRSIDAKLGALLALALDSHLRATGIAKPKERSIDLLLTNAGLSASEIAALLGKTPRAVRLVLQNDKRKRIPKK